MADNKALLKLQQQTDCHDDATMDVLFSPFRDNRDVNPQSWDSKLSFWKDRIVQHSIETNRIVINTKQLPLSFTRNGKTPTCLHVVCDEMRRSGDLRSLADVNATAPSGWLSWGFGVLVKKPLSWTFGTFVKKPLSALIGNKDDAGEDLVVMETLKLKAKQVLETHYSHVENESTDCVVSYSQLAQQCRSVCADQQTFDLALMQLLNDNLCTLCSEENGEKVFRFAKRSKRCVTPPTDCDIKLYRLKQAEKTLQLQIEKLTQDMERCRNEAKGYLKKGLKNSAKNCLRRKKKLETMRDGKETAAENIHHMLTIIQQAESNKMILDAYTSGSSAFKQITQRYGLTTSMIDDVMSNVQEVYDDSEDINETLASGITTADEPSVEDLEAELSLILAGDAEVTQEMSHEPHQELVDAMCKMRVVDDFLGEEGASAQISASNVSLDLPDVPQFHPSSPPPAEAIRVSAKRPSTKVSPQALSFD